MHEKSTPSNINNLRRERLLRGWSQQELADQLAITPVTVSRWERGTQKPGPIMRLKLCSLYGKSAEELGLVVADAVSSNSTIEEALEVVTTNSSLPDGNTLWTVPYRRNPYFTGRDEILHLLEQHLSVQHEGEKQTMQRVALTQPHAIKGLGGIGKTQIAVEYAYRAREHDQYAYTLWINAASEETTITSFVALAEMLPAFPAKTETNRQKLIQAIKHWLEQCQERWCLIFDNADDPSWLHAYLPQQGNGNILLTTRANAIGSFATSLEVEKMGFIEGTHLLLRRAQRLAQASDEEINEAGNIVMTLDHFPLAIEQAGAYIEETECSIEDYLKLYQTHHHLLLAKRGTQSTNYPNSVATTWSLSFDKVAQANPAAAELLRLCAFLAPDHIPEELLTAGSPHWPQIMQQATADPFAFDQMLETLLAYSLVKRLAKNHLLSIHRLVQRVQIDRMEVEEQRQWAERIVSAVNAVFPIDPRNETTSWSQCLRYLEQAQACATLIQQWHLLLTAGADLLSRTGIYLYEHASYTIAEPLFQRALHIYEQTAGSEQLQMAFSLYNLAILYRDQGNYMEAEPLFQRALHIYEQTVEPVDVNIAATLNGLGGLYREQGRYVEAEPLFQRALHIYEQCEAPEDPQVITALLNNLAILYFEQGKYTEAEPLFQRTLSSREQILGTKHPRVASSLNGLATLYHMQGRYDEAEPLYQRALHIWEQSMGPEHPLVAYPLYNLAELYREQDQTTEAEPLYLRALHIREQSLGPKHLQVADTLNGLAVLYHTQGKYAEAKQLFQRALYICEQSGNPEHPQMAAVLQGLAELYRDQGRYIEAEQLFQQVLQIQEHTLEPDHPNLADTLYSFAILLELQGKREAAVSHYIHALTIREKIYKAQHPKIIETRQRLQAISGVLWWQES